MNNWVRIEESPEEKKWCWWTLAVETGRWIYLFSNRTNQVVAKFFLWQWESEEDKK